MELYRAALKDTGLRPPHVATLTILRAEPVGQQALGEFIGLDAVRLVGILNDLETAGLIERRRDCVDRRRHNVAITCSGRARLAAVERAAEQVDEQIFAGLSAAQRDQLADLLRLVDESHPTSDVCLDDGHPSGPDAAAAGCGVV